MLIFTKRTLMIVLGLVFVFGYSSAQESKRPSFAEAVSSGEEGDIAGNKLLESMLLGKYSGVSVDQMLTPDLFAYLSNYATRKVLYGKKDVYFNGRLSIMLDGIITSPEEIQTPEKYIFYLRKIINETRDMYLLSKSITAYATLIEKNRPAEADEPGVDIDTLFVSDVTEAIKRVSTFSLNSKDNEAVYILMVATPFITAAMERNNDLIYDAYVQANLSYMTLYYTSRISSEYMDAILTEALSIEARLMAANNQ